MIANDEYGNSYHQKLGVGETSMDSVYSTLGTQDPRIALILATFFAEANENLEGGRTVLVGFACFVAKKRRADLFPYPSHAM